jgi:uracil-DNA glycosylase
VSGAAELLARYLLQRQSLGEDELVLDPAALDSLRRLRSTGSGENPVDVAESGARPSPPPHQPRPESAPRPPRRPETSAPLVRIGSLNSLDELRDAAMGCVACGLSATRTTVVFGEGDPNARLVVVGEAPGADEDRTGRPFVGRAGRLLDTLLASIGFPRPTVYICNVLKCRPPGNRNPRPDEVEACSPFLRKQIEFVRPEVILAVGTFPAQTLLGSTDPIGRLRGTLYEYEGVPLVPTYHPAALLRNPGWIRPVWEDLQRLRAVIDR